MPLRLIYTSVQSMNRTARMKCAKDTVAICETGFYTSPNGKEIEIASALKNAVDGTVIYSEENPPRGDAATAAETTSIEVHNQTTFDAILNLERGGYRNIACLNFASARNPGGGFLTGAQAQEEALARASGLYPCLLKAREYYERNRAHQSAIYLDLVIYSPLVPFFRDDSGALLERPILASVITAPAPNAAAVMQNEPHHATTIESALKRRAGLILQVAQAHNIKCLVLGAWGCGVFRNDPKVVSKSFADLLKGDGKFGGVFTKVVFAVFDRSEGQVIFRAFQDTFRGVNA